MEGSRRLFRQYGFTGKNWKQFEQSLKRIIIQEDVQQVEQTPLGNKYVVEGFLDSKSGKRVKIVTVWVILDGETEPRFVTAYPGGM